MPFFKLQVFWFLLVIELSQSQQVDLTVEPLAKGYDVSLTVVRKIYRSGIFDEDDFFLTHRVAYIATEFGEDPKTYEEGSSYRGIWQLTEDQFNETKTNPELINIRQRIPIAFPQIGEWESVGWNDLLKPLHNGLAFRLFLETLKEFSSERPYLPTLLADQGDFYRQFFNASTDPQEFKNNILTYESNPSCPTELDIVFVQDGSCTVYEANLTNYLTYNAELVDSFTFANIRVGLVVFSTQSLPIFSLDNNFTQEELRYNILNAGRPLAQYTRTELGIKDGFGMLQSGSPRPGGIAQVLVIITDGQSIDPLEKITNETMAAGINTFALGTAFGWMQSQMLQIAHNQPAHIFKSGYSFNLFPELVFRSILEICSVTTNPPLNSVSEGTLRMGEKRYYKFSFAQVTGDWLSVTLVSQGEVRSIFSYSEQTPSSAFFDGEIVAQFTTDIPKNGNAHVYIIIEGIQTLNSYGLLAQ